MNAEIKKEQGKTYLSFIPEQTYCNFAVEMLTENTLKGLLPFEERIFNGDTYFFYDITGGRRLKHRTEEELLGGNEVRRLLQSLYCLAGELYSYFLEPGCVVLDSAYIYEKENEYLFCYEPFENAGDGEENISSFANELISCIDHEDEEAVVLSYSLYRISKEEGYSLLKILEEVLKDGQKEETEEEKAGAEGDLDIETEIPDIFEDADGEAGNKKILQDKYTTGIFFLLFVVSLSYFVSGFSGENLYQVQTIVMIIFLILSVPGMALGFVAIDIKEKK